MMLFARTSRRIGLGRLSMLALSVGLSLSSCKVSPQQDAPVACSDFRSCQSFADTSCKLGKVDECRQAYTSARTFATNAAEKERSLEGLGDVCLGQRDCSCSLEAYEAWLSEVPTRTRARNAVLNWRGICRPAPIPAPVLVTSHRKAGTIVALRFSPDGQQLLSISEEGELALWNVSRGKAIWTSPDARSTLSYSKPFLDFSDDGQLVLAVDQGIVRVLDATNGRATLNWVPYPFSEGDQLKFFASVSSWMDKYEWAGRGWPLARACFRPKSHAIFVEARQGIADVADQNMLASLRAAQPPKESQEGGGERALESAPLEAFASSCSVPQATATSSDRDLEARAGSSGIEISRKGATTPFRAISSNESAILATMTVSISTLITLHEGRVMLWDLSTGRRLTTVKTQKVPLVTTSGDGAGVLLVNDQGSPVLLDGKTGAVIWQGEGNRGSAVARIALAGSATEAMSFVQDGSGVTVAINRLGTRLWSHDTPPLLGALQSDSSTLAFFAEPVRDDHEHRLRVLMFAGATGAFVQRVDVAFASDLPVTEFRRGRRLRSSGLEIVAFVARGQVYEGDDTEVIAPGTADSAWLTSELSAAEQRDLCTAKVDELLSQTRKSAWTPQLSRWNTSDWSPWHVYVTVNNEVRILSRTRCEEIARLSVYDKEGESCAITTPDGYYLAPVASRSELAFQIGSRSYPLEQLDLIFDRPSTVLARLGLADRALIEAYKKQERMRAKTAKDMPRSLMALKMTEAPTVRVEVGGFGPVTTRSSIRLHIIAQALQNGIASVELRVNGVLVPLPGASPPRDPKTPTWQLTLAPEVALTAGRNDIRVLATDTLGISSLREGFEIFRDAPRAASLFVASIGISRYANHAFDLQLAAKDAQDIGAALGQTPELFTNTHRLVLVDSDSTRSGIKAGVRKLFSTAKEEDAIVLFLAGHGMLSANGRYYFLPFDGDPDRLAATALSFDELLNLVTDTRARMRLLIIDSCHAGERDERPVLVADSTAPNRGFHKLVKDAEDARLNAPSSCVAIWERRYWCLRRVPSWRASQRISETASLPRRCSRG
jgi:hypothetical protein